MTGAKSISLDPADFTLLVVDDVEDNRDLLQRRFSRRGFRVVTADSGESAFEALAGGDVDLVILDINMPGMSGIDVLRRIRAEPRFADLPVIMATARTGSDDMVEALELGANDYVTKPIDFPVLQARVMTTLRTAQAQRPAATSGEIGPGMNLAGRYVLDRKIGEGGFGAVYRAIHEALQRTVAIKLMNRQQMGTDAAERFRREGMHACRIQHPNALVVLDSGVTDDGIAYLVTELLEGETLEAEMMRRQRLPFVRTAELLAAVCDALEAAHQAGVVHRDIKPANVYLHRTGQGDEVAKVLDFGIAKLVSDVVAGHRMTIEGGLIGTPVYMAPERFASLPYDGRTDVYSVGVMLHEMITGTLPFAALHGATSIEPMALAMLHATAPPVPMRELDRAIPAALERAALAALAKSPDDRPTAGDLAALLRTAVVGVPADATSSYSPQARVLDGPTLLSAGGVRPLANAPTADIRGPVGEPPASKQSPGDDEP